MAESTMKVGDRAEVERWGERTPYVVVAVSRTGKVATLQQGGERVVARQHKDGRWYLSKSIFRVFPA